jgi:hypothetical protein
VAAHAHPNAAASVLIFGDRDTTGKTIFCHCSIRSDHPWSGHSTAVPPGMTAYVVGLSVAAALDTVASILIVLLPAMFIS